MRSSDLLALGPAYRHVLLLQNLKDGIVKPRRMTKFKGKLIGKWKHLYKVFQQFSVGLQIRRRLQTPPNLQADRKLLEDFVQVLPFAYQFAFEFRHASWFDDAILEILKQKNVAVCWAESEKITAPHAATANFLYYRFRRPEYSKEQLKQIAGELKRESEGREVFAFFK